MSKSSAPEPPDYSEIAAASKEAAELAYQLGQDQLAWAQEQYASDSEITDQVVESFLHSMDYAQQKAEEDRARYEELYQPLEDQLVAEAADYATPERKQAEMGRAAATTAQQFDQAREASQRELESYGLNPSSTRYAALDLGARTSQAAASAAAANQAYEQTVAHEEALRSEAINVGKGYPGQAMQAMGASTAAGTGASQATTSATQTASNTMTAPASYITAGTNALDVWGNTLNMGYSNEIAAYNAQQAASSGWGSALGMLGAAGVSIFAQEGGAIPEGASPSGGAKPDDVPAMVSAGEFVVPEDVVKWKGQEYFYKEIGKSRKDQAEKVGTIVMDRQAQNPRQQAVPAGGGPPAAGAGAPPPAAVSADPRASQGLFSRQFASRAAPGQGVGRVSTDGYPGVASAQDFSRQAQVYLRGNKQAVDKASGATRAAVMPSSAGPGGSPPVVGPQQARLPKPRPPYIPPDQIPSTRLMQRGGAVEHAPAIPLY